MCSYFVAQENKGCHYFHCFPIYLPWNDGTGCHDLRFWNVEFYANFFTLLFSPSSRDSLDPLCFLPLKWYHLHINFPGGSDTKASAYNAGDLGSIPGWGRWNSSWIISNPERWCCESAALNIPANLEKSAVATGLEKVSFHSNPKERQCQRMLKLPHECIHLTC